MIGDASSLNHAFRSAGMSAKRFEGQAGRTRRVAGAAFKAISVGALAVGAFAVEGLKKSVEAADEHEHVMKQTAAAIKSTGGAAKLTAAHIDHLSQSIQNVTGVSRDEIQAAANNLLAFTHIHGKTFDTALKVIEDYSARTGKDAKNAAVIFGKALEDPVGKIGALSRAGVVFDAGTKNLIKDLVTGADATDALAMSGKMLTEKQREQLKKAKELKIFGIDALKYAHVHLNAEQLKTFTYWSRGGHILKAQNIILRELQRRYGGAGKAAGSTFAGRLKILHYQLRDIEIIIGNAILPQLSKWADAISAWLSKARNQRKITEAVKNAMHGLSAGMRIAVQVIRRAARFARAFSSAVGGWKHAAAIVISGLLAYKFLKIAAAIFRIRKAILATQATGGLGGVLGGRGGVGGAGGKGGRKIPVGAIAKSVLGYAAVYEGVKSLSGDKNLGPDFSSSSAADVFVGKNPYPKGSPGYQAWRAGARGQMPKMGNTVARDPAYEAGLRAGHHKEEHHVHVHVDGREVAKVVTKHDRRSKRRTTAQRGGRHPGAVLD